MFVLDELSKLCQNFVSCLKKNNSLSSLGNTFLFTTKSYARYIILYLVSYMYLSSLSNLQHNKQALLETQIHVSTGKMPDLGVNCR